MKLLQINSYCNIGSTGRLAEDLGQVAIKKGWESYIAYGREGKESRSNVFKIDTSWEVYLHAIYSRLLDRHCFGSFFATKRLVKFIKQIQPDIIQIHNLHGYYVNIPVLFRYLQESKIPVVWSLHDCWTMTGHCSHFVLAKCDKWKTMCEKCPIINDYPTAYIDQSRRNYLEKKQYFTRLPNLNIVSASKWLANIVKQSYFADKPIHIIPNGIDTSIFHPYTNGDVIRKKYNLDKKFVIIATGTSWDNAKGLKDFYKLQEVLPEDCRIVLVGLSSSQINELPSTILGLPRTSSAVEMAELYSMADVVLSLSYMEAFGLTPIEGYACGTPAIVYNCTSTPELITDQTGFVVEPGDISEVLEKLMIIKEKGKASYRDACVKEGITKYSKEVCFERYINMYQTIINGE